jgi:thioredoxin-related protein
MENWKTGRVVRLNTISEATRKYAEKINVKDTPTFILFDAEGKSSAAGTVKRRSWRSCRSRYS